MRKTQKLRRSLALSLALFFVALTSLSVLPQKAAAQASGGGSFISETLLNQVKDKNKYMFLRYCFDRINIDKVTESEVDNWDFFEAGGTDYFSIIGNIYGPNESGTWGCETEDNIRNAFESLGFTDSRRTFCALSGSMLVKENTTFDDEYKDDEDCYSKEVSGDYHWDNDQDDMDKLRESFTDLVKNKKDNVEGSGVSAVVDQGLKPEQEYVRYYLSFMNQCGVSDDQVKLTTPYKDGDADPDDRYQVPVVDSQGTPTNALGTGQVSSGSSVAMWAEVTSGGPEYKLGDGENSDMFYDVWPRGEVISCNSAITKVREHSAAYAAYIKANPGETDAAETPDGSGSGTGNSDPTCESESGPLGWALCPALRLIDGAIGFLDKAINNLLFINQDVYGDDGITDAWAVMRNIALLLLVPMMIFMVIGTAVGFGPFDPYTVKKALPRMFIAVIFIVISLPITRFGVELSNTVGQGMGNLIMSASTNKADSLETIFATNGSGGSGDSLFTGAVIGSVAAGAAFGGITIGILGSFALITAVALLLGFAILVMRQVLVVMLMVIAPLAILVWIFPGNDKLWAIWKTSLIAMLLMYPIIAVLIASGKFVAGIVSF